LLKCVGFTICYFLNVLQTLMLSKCKENFYFLKKYIIIILCQHSLCKKKSLAADLQNVPSNFNVQILNNFNPVKEVLKECPL